MTYLAGGSYVAAGLSVLAKARSRDRVLLRAYSFDASPVLEALESACARGVVADASQCAKTKQQWQSLKRVATAGVSVRLAAGHSVRDAYLSDGRGATVGAGLKGLHHAKAKLDGRRRDDCRLDRRQSELVDEFEGQLRVRTAPDSRLGGSGGRGLHPRLRKRFRRPPTWTASAPTS